MLNRGLLLFVAALVAGCWFLPQGDPPHGHITLFASNRSQEAFVLSVDDPAVGRAVCYDIAPGTVGKFYDAPGEIVNGSRAPLWLYSADGLFLASLGPHTNIDIFVITSARAIDVVAAGFKEVRSGGSERFLDVPAVTELDGRVPPDFFPTTNKVCVPSSSGSR